MLRALLCSLILLAFAPRVDAQSVELKAARLFDQKEWASAEAMYTLLIDRQPDRAAYYGRVLGAAAMRELTDPALAPQNAALRKEMLSKALKSRVPVDSLFRAVEATAFELGHADFYQTFLERTAEDEPWLARKVNALMLNFVAFRRDGEAMVTYASRLLEGAPDSENLLLTRAQGLLLLGRDDEARADYLRALEVNPSSIEALLYLGEMALCSGDKAAALDYLTRANALKPTPRLAATLTSLTARGDH